MKLIFKILLVCFLISFFIPDCDNSDPSTIGVETEQKVVSGSPSVQESSIKTSESHASTFGKDPYYILHVAFEGRPTEREIKPMMERVMQTHDFPISNDNILKVGNMLVELRKNSAIGVTEMQILRHMYQNGSSSRKIDVQAAYSATLLETTK